MKYGITRFLIALGVLTSAGFAEAQCPFLGIAECSTIDGQVLVTWDPPAGNYGSFDVTRDGIVIATVAASAREYLDPSPPVGLHDYGVIAGCGSQAFPCTGHAGVEAQLSVTDEIAGPGSTTTASVLIDQFGTDGLNGGAFGIVHDPALLTVTNLALGADLAATNGGTGPALLFLNDDPTPGPNGERGVSLVFNIDSTFPVTQLIAPGAGIELLRITYEVSPLAQAGAVTALSFFGGLGQPSTGLAVVLETTTMSLFDLPLAGSITVSGERGGGDGPNIMRGDVNSDGTMTITDPIEILQFLFMGGQAGCRDAFDINDDGVLNITDASGLLLHLFAGGVAPSAPYPFCGPDTSVDTLDCTSAPGICN